MKISTYFSIFGVIAAAFGAAFAAVPELLGPVYGIPIAPHTQLMSRYFGAALLLVGILYWLIRGVRDDETKCAVLKANLVGGVAGTAISLYAVLTGLENQMAWSTVLLYVFLAVGALYFLAALGRRD